MALMFIVNEPSLNGGRKLRPNPAKITSETMRTTVVPTSTFLLFASAFFFVTQQITAHYRSKGERHEGGCEQSRDERYSERCEHPALHTGEKKQGNETHDDNQC